MANSLAPETRRWTLFAAGCCLLPMLLQMPLWLAAVILVASVPGVFSSRRWSSLLRVPLAAMMVGLCFAAYRFHVGRDSVSALLATMLVMKTYETDSPRDARSLIGFALFSPFAAFLQDQGPVTLLLGLPAAAAVLLASAALAARTSPGEKRAPPWRQLGSIARMLVVALPLAFAGFWLFPRLASPMWGLPANVSGHSGLGDRMEPSQWLDLLTDDSAAFRVRFLGSTPAPEQLYWRGPVLVYFDGQAWTRNEAADRQTAPEIVARAPAYRYELTLEPTDRQYLIALDLPLAAPAESRLNGELTAITNEKVTGMVSYRGQSAATARYLQPLDKYERTQDLALPAGLNPRTQALARQWRAETSDPLALSRRFLEWVRRDFKYTISAPPVGRNAVDDFLFETREGFCQHFSSAFTVFMRAAGVPARVVTGYAGGRLNPYGDYWRIRHQDAHAWTEIWIEGRGWLRIDPTAAVAPENILDTIDERQLAQGSGLGGALSPIFDLGDWAREGWNNLMLGFNATRQRMLLRPLGIDEASNEQLSVAFGIGAGVALAFTLWLLLRERRGLRDPLDKAWRRFLNRLARAGIEKRSEEPALSFGQRAAEALPRQSEQLAALSRGYADCRYAAPAMPAEVLAALVRALRDFRPERTSKRTGA